MAYESQRMAIPAARFVGMSSYDAERFELPAHVTMPLTEEDRWDIEEANERMAGKAYRIAAKIKSGTKRSVSISTTTFS